MANIDVETISQTIKTDTDKINQQPSTIQHTQEEVIDEFTETTTKEIIEDVIIDSSITEENLEQ